MKIDTKSKTDQTCQRLCLNKDMCDKTLPSRSSIPRHLLLREIGGCINAKPAVLLSSKSGLNQIDKSPHNLSRDKHNDNDKAKCFENHPRINVNCMRHSLRILKDLISSSNRQFTISENHQPKVSLGGRRGVTYADGKLFVRNNVNKTYDCFAIRENHRKPCYFLPLQPHWEDAADITYSTSSQFQKPILIILRKGNCLNIHDLKTGYLIKTIFLGIRTISVGRYDSVNNHITTSPFSFNIPVTYKEVNVDFETSYIYVKSTRKPKPSDVLVSFAVFSYPPLEFVAQFHIHRSTFGMNITDAEVAQNILMVMEGQAQASVTRLYNLQHILEKRHPCKLDDYIQKLDIYRNLHHVHREGVVGNIAFGVPTNLDILERPPCLYSIKSYKQYIEISPAADMKFINCDINSREFKLNNLADGALVNNGNVGKLDEEARLNFRFHPDDSSRTIFMHPPHLSIYEIHKIENKVCDSSSLSIYKLHKVFNYTAEESINFEANKRHIHSEKDSFDFYPIREKVELNDRPLLTNSQRLDDQNSIQNEVSKHKSQKECVQTSLGNDNDSKIVKTRSGRTVVQRLSTWEYQNITQKTTDITYDYENELDILAILKYTDINETSPDRDDDDEFDDTEYSFLEHVVLVDSTTHTVIKRIPINEVLSVSKASNLNVSVIMDRDILLIKVQSNAKTLSYVYRLCSVAYDEESKQKKVFSDLDEDEPLISWRKRSR